jgi:hypothetical protein
MAWWMGWDVGQVYAHWRMASDRSVALGFVTPKHANANVDSLLVHG